MSTIKVFVYGTLKPGEANYQNYCQGKVRSRVSAYTLFFDMANERQLMKQFGWVDNYSNYSPWARFS